MGRGVTAVPDHVIASIGQASTVHGDAARARVAGAGAPMLERLAIRLGGARTTRGRVRRIA